MASLKHEEQRLMLSWRLMRSMSAGFWLFIQKILLSVRRSNSRREVSPNNVCNWDSNTMRRRGISSWKQSRMSSSNANQRPRVGSQLLRHSRCWRCWRTWSSISSSTGHLTRQRRASSQSKQTVHMAVATVGHFWEERGKPSTQEWTTSKCRILLRLLNRFEHSMPYLRIFSITKTRKDCAIP